METANPILGNPLLLAAILLFLAILPRALRQKRKTALDRAVERFEKEELKVAAQKNPDEDNRQKKPIALRDGSLAYLKEDRPTQKKSIEQDGGIPPFPSQEDEEDERVKIVKTGVPISHYETADPPPRKKAKLIKRDFSIAPDENRKPSKKTISAQKKEEQSKTPANDPKTTWNEELPAHPINDDLDSNNNWIEAEIPGLTTEPTAPEKPEEDVPVFKASPKKKVSVRPREASGIS